MLRHILPRILHLWSVRSPRVTTTMRKKVTHRPWVTGHNPVCFSSGGDREDYSQDPIVKEWLKDMQKDFTGKEEEGEDCQERFGVKESDKGEDCRMKDAEVKDGQDILRSGKESVKEEGNEGRPLKVWSQLLTEKYQKLEGHTQIIYDYDEERMRREAGLEEEEEEVKEEVRLERGKTGVFDVEELVELLREDNAKDVVVIQVPEEMKYVNYMVIVSSDSQRHRNALAQVVRKVYKMKKSKRDPSVLMEGKGSVWVAMDMGNIVLHIMSPNTREAYDLETLWTVGAEFDEKAQVTEDDLLVGVQRGLNPMAAPLSSSEPQASSEAVT